MLADFPSSPGHRQLRQFGALCVAIPPLIACIAGAGEVAIAGCLVLGLVLGLVGRFRPRWLGPLFIALMLIAWPIGRIVGEILLLLLYYAVVVPIGLCYRLAGRDPLECAFEPKRNSYWVEKRTPEDPLQYYRPW